MFSRPVHLYDKIVEITILGCCVRLYAWLEKSSDFSLYGPAIIFYVRFRPVWGFKTNFSFTPKTRSYVRSHWLQVILVSNQLLAYYFIYFRPRFWGLEASRRWKRRTEKDFTKQTMKMRAADQKQTRKGQQKSIVKSSWKRIQKSFQRWASQGKETFSPSVRHVLMTSTFPMGENQTAANMWKPENTRTKRNKWIVATSSKRN